jgi:lysophospholipase L1-like esterase
MEYTTHGLVMIEPEDHPDFLAHMNLNTQRTEQAISELELQVENGGVDLTDIHVTLGEHGEGIAALESVTSEHGVAIDGLDSRVEVLEGVSAEYVTAGELSAAVAIESATRASGDALIRTDMRGIDESNTQAHGLFNTRIATEVSERQAAVTELAERIDSINLDKPLTGKTAVFLGDSITWGQSGYNTTYARCYANEFGTLTGATIQNLGAGGATASDTPAALPPLAGTQFEGREWFSKQVRLITGTPDYIYFMFGINDYGYNALIGSGERDENQLTVCGGIRKGIEYLQRTYPKARIIGLAPLYAPTENTANTQGLSVSDYRQNVVGCIRSMNVPVIDFCVSLGLNEHNWETFPNDSTGLHPAEHTHIEMANILANNIHVASTSKPPTIAERGATGLKILPPSTHGGNLPNIINNSSLYWVNPNSGDAFVYINGVISGVGAGSSLFTLPKAVQPAYDIYVPICRQGENRSNDYVMLGATGSLDNGYSGSGEWISCLVTIPLQFRKYPTISY